jgi:YVTN family beta-propeller protein
MGVVYLAEDTRLGRRVAVKLLSGEHAEDPPFRERFVRESRLAASLDHPNIVPIYAAGEENGILYVAMRFVEGRDLRARVAEEGTVEPVRAVGLAAQVANALDAAHARGLVHRDVKPANVLLARIGEDEHAYLTDFGLAKDTGSAAALTRTGHLVGTVDYLAPEVIEGHSADARSDQYALACLLYECLSGKPPFRRASDAATLWAHVRDTPPPLPAEAAGLQEPFRRGLAKRPQDRYASCGEFVAAVRARLPEAPAEKARPSRRILALGGAALLALVAIAVVATARLARSSEPVAKPIPPPNSLVVIDPRSGEPIGSPIPVGRAPSGVVVSGRSVWVANAASRTVTLVDATTRQVSRTVQLGGTPTAIASGAGGSVWIAEGLAREVVQVFPDANRIPSATSLPGCCPGPTSIAVAGDLVWIGDPGGVWRMDVGRRIPRRATPAWPASGGATTDPDGNSWLTDGWDNLVYVNREAGVLTQRIPQFGQPSAITWAEDGAWVALPRAKAVVKVDASGASGSPIAVAGGPTAIASGGGAVWVGTRAGTIVRLDPLTLSRRTVTAGGHVSALAYGAGALWATTEAGSAVANASGKLAYTDESEQLVIGTATGSGLVTTTLKGSATNGMADWSPSGRRLAFVDTQENGPPQAGGFVVDSSCTKIVCSVVSSMRSDGTGRRQLSHPPFYPGDFAPRWSPDGRALAVWRVNRRYGSSSGPATAQVLLMGADGKRASVVYESPYASLVTPGLDWSPDGRHLVVQRLAKGHVGLAVIRRDGTHPRVLTASDASGPRWSPDGTRIAYFSSVDGPGIYVTGVDGRLTAKLLPTSSGTGSLAWSPDGRQLAFGYGADAARLESLLGDTGDWSGIYVLNADGTGLSTLAKGPGAFPDWAPHS